MKAGWCYFYRWSLFHAWVYVTDNKHRDSLRNSFSWFVPSPELPINSVWKPEKLQDIFAPTRDEKITPVFLKTYHFSSKIFFFQVSFLVATFPFSDAWRNTGAFYQPAQKIKAQAQLWKLEVETESIARNTNEITSNFQKKKKKKNYKN